MSWGLNFGWKASRALIFGLAVSGVSSHSPVVQGDPMGPFWLTGGAYGLDGSWLAFVVLLAALPVVYRITRDLDFRYNAPVIVPGGIPVDLDAAARAQHEAAMGPAAPAPAASGLVQIGMQGSNDGNREQGTGNNFSSSRPSIPYSFWLLAARLICLFCPVGANVCLLAFVATMGGSHEPAASLLQDAASAKRDRTDSCK